MNKKFIIIGVVSVIIIVVIIYLANYTMGYFSASGMAFTSRGLYNPEIKYITISNSFLEKYPVVKNMMDKLDNRTGGYSDSSEFPEAISLSNADARNLQTVLDELKPENPGYDFGLYIDYQKRYYRIGVVICYPECGSIR